MSSRQVQTFISYAHKDAELRDRLLSALRRFESEGHIAIWYDQLISPGERYFDKIASAIDQSRLILLLLTEHYLGSQPCLIEARRAKALADAGQATMVPIVMRSCAWQTTPLEIQTAQAVIPRAALTSTAESDATLEEIVQGVARALVGVRGAEEPDEYRLLTPADLVKIRKQLDISISAIRRAMEPYSPPPASLLIDLAQLEARYERVVAAFNAKTGTF